MTETAATTEETEVFNFPLQQLLNALPFRDERYFIQTPQVDGTDPDVCFARKVLDIIDTHFADALECATRFRKSFCGTEQNGVCVALEFSPSDDGGNTSRGLMLFVASVTSEGRKLVFTPHYILTGYIQRDEGTGMELFHPSDSIVDMDTTNASARLVRAEYVEDFFQSLCFAEDAMRHLCAGLPIDLRQHQAWVQGTDEDQLQRQVERICTRGIHDFVAEICNMQVFTGATVFPGASGPFIN